MRFHLFQASAALAGATLSASAEMKPIPNSCMLLSQQEVSVVVGSSVKVGAKSDLAGTCIFNDGTGHAVFSVRGSIHANKYDAYAELQALEQVTPLKWREAAFGPGDHADVLMTRQGDLVLLIQHQSKLVVLSLLHTAGPDVSSRKLFLEQAGRQVSARL